MFLLKNFRAQAGASGLLVCCLTIGFWDICRGEKVCESLRRICEESTVMYLSVCDCHYHVLEDGSAENVGN